MRPAYVPFLIQIDLRARVEECPDVIPLIRRKLMRSAFDGKDGPMRLSFVKSEAGTASSIYAKYQAIADHPDVTCLRVLSTCANNVSSAGIDDPVVSKINEAWRKHRKRREAENMDRADRSAIEQVKRASGQSVMRGRRPGKSPAKPNKSELHAAAHRLFEAKRQGAGHDSA